MQTGYSPSLRRTVSLCDAEIVRCPLPGTTIGMNSIKQRRLTNALNSRPGLCVGDCVPFYFCPRSVMLYVIYQANHSKLSYRGGQEPIVHLEADLHQAVAWAEEHEQRWAFTLGNAGASYFEDRCDLAQLDEIDWNTVQAGKWSGTGIDSSVKEQQAGGIPHREAVPLGTGGADRRSVA